jgi:hypothetical protein
LHPTAPSESLRHPKRDQGAHLCLGQHKPQEEDGFNFLVERKTILINTGVLWCRGELWIVHSQEPAQEVVDEDDAGDDDPVHQPRRQLRLVIGLESLVTGKDGE